MASILIAFRLHLKKDKDILDALENAKNRTKEIKKLIRQGLNQNIVTQTLPSHTVITSHSLGSNIQQKKTSKKISTKEIAKNLLIGFD